MLQLSILTPGRVFFSKKSEIQSISVPSADGQLGILQGHCPLVTSFSAGLLSVRSEDSISQHFALVDGFVKIQENIVTVLCRFASDSKDLESMETLEKNHEKLLQDSESSGQNTHQKELDKSSILLKLKKKVSANQS